MALMIDHVNTVLGKMRQAPITALDTDTTTVAYRCQEAVRRAVNRVWNAKQWSFKIRSASLTLVSGTNAYALPGYVGEIFSILSDTDPYKVGIYPESQFDQYIPNPTETGSPRVARLFDMSGAVAQPATAGIVSVSSSSASDSTQKVLVKGLINSSYVDYEQLTLAGTSTVTSTKSFSSIIAVTKSAPTAGAITLLIGATTVAVMWPQETVHRRRYLRLYPEPDSAYVLTLKHFGAAPALTHAYEDTEIPTRWDYVVDQFAFALALQSQGQEQDVQFKTQFDVASKFLETDMAAEEYIASEEIIVPAKWTNQEDINQWGVLPAGYGYIS